MKKMCALLLAAAMTIGMFAGCGKKEEKPADAKGTETQSGETKAASEDNSQVPDEITIGFVASMSGENAQAGQYKKDAWAVIQKELEATDGCITIMGKQVKVNVEFVDTDSKADVTANAYSKCINDLNAVAIVGPDESSLTLAGAPLAQEAGIPVISTFATNEKVTQIGDYIFRACYIDPFQGQVAANYAYNELGAKTAAVLYSNADAYATGLMESFKENFEALGGEVVAVETYAGSDVKDFNAQLSNINAKTPDLLWLPNQASEIPLQIQQADAMGITATMMGPDSWDVTTVPETAGAEALEGSYYISCFSAESDNEVAQAWVKEFEEVNGYKPAAHATLAYEALKIVINGLENLTSFSEEELRDNIAATDLDLPSGRVTFDEGGNPNKAAVIMKYEDGVGHYVTSVQP
ncbi:ABC transporter substrate-binding protein [Lacrimispora sp. NSJ-141]|uniref:ABC transporter substrate-binding protein n=1 Tax=Lientehia hominis TaxID=2897778 RepID=A0AAP2RK33_9FIRM|nr:ABC transporter substrate-binding protein [Lientehia hominis]MCD2493477.1 ABC transporter substrate-binding protein [Lientehia hominis]